jgi:integrase
MSKVNYYLKGVPTDAALSKLKKENNKLYNEEVNKKRPIIMSVACNGKREIFSTGKFISLKLWDKAQQRIKNLIETPTTSLEDGEWLDAKKNEVEKYLNLAQREYRYVNKDELYQLIRGEVKSTKNSSTLKEALSEFLSEHKTERGNSLKPNTKKKYYTLIQHIEEFQQNKLFIPATYTHKWIIQFKQFLLDDMELIDNSVCKYIKTLKTFLSFFKEKGIPINVNLKSIKVAENEQEVICLTLDELKYLETVKFENPVYQRIFDVFIFQCNTGARYSDIAIIKKEDLKERRNSKGEVSYYWQYRSVKTNELLSTPINQKCIEILEKYKDLDTPLPRYCNQIMNRELKKLAVSINLDRKVRKIKYVDGNLIEEFFHLYEVISTHLARKTFISTSLQLGVPERFVRKITGHKDDRSFRRYVELFQKPLEEVTTAWENFYGEEN